MKAMWLISVLAVGVLITPSFADEVSHRRAANKLLDLTHIQQLLDQVKTSVEAAVTQQLEALTLSQEGREAAAKAQQEMMKWFSQFVAWQKTRDMYIDVYVETFTEDELNELIAFNQSPLGQKVLHKMPQLVQRSLENTQQVLREMEPELQRRLRKIMVELQERYKA